MTDSLLKYEYQQRIARFRHKQSLLRSKLLNLNALCMLLLIAVISAGVWHVISLEHRLIDRIDLALSHMATHQPTPPP